MTEGVVSLKHFFEEARAGRLTLDPNGRLTSSEGFPVLSTTGQPIVVYMGLKSLPVIVRQLLRGGLAPETPAAVIMAATTPEQRVLTAPLGEIAAAAGRQGFAAPAVIVVGEIVAMRQRLGAAP